MWLSEMSYIYIEQGEEWLRQLEVFLDIKYATQDASSHSP